MGSALKNNISIAELLSLIKKQKNPIIKRRLEVLLSHLQNIRPGIAAQRLKLSYDGYRAIIVRYNKYGLKRLFNPRVGGNEKLSYEYFLEVTKWVGNPEKLDFFYTINDCRHLVKRIFKKWNVKITAQTLYYKLRKYEKNYFSA